MTDGRRRAKARAPLEVAVARALTAPLLCVAAMLYAVYALGGPDTRAYLAGTLLLLAAAWALAVRRLIVRRAAGKTLAQLQALEPADFEAWTAARFRELGYRVRITGAAGDHGVDLVLEAPGELAIVQCKRYRSRVVGEAALRDLYGAMHDSGATRAFLVTTGRLTRAALAWAAGKPIVVWDGAVLARPAAPFPRDGGTAGGQPLCPRCGAPLVERRMPGVDGPFLGCSRHPRCRHTQPVEADRTL
ncbi:MAG TPA: restriction endonuclease [Anaerolineae bacterium]|nr:restriction endonuclease [Anaerolineae bacterium]HOQ97868.1 restriction endonuclease [Anaerolineae bacterium]HPL28143.1 restriction endonuclease [Anaerolineae bacterium]